MYDLLISAALIYLAIGGLIVAIVWVTIWLDDRWHQRPAPSADELDLAAALRDLEAELDRLAAALQRPGGRP